MDESVRPTAEFGTYCGPIDAYLIEARSIGGISGSPVFVHETVIMNRTLTRPSDNTQHAKELLLHGEFYLLGLMHGHWEVLPKDKNSNPIKTKSRDEDTVNTGIAVVIPAKKILDVLYHPEFVEMRRLGEEAELKKRHGVTTLD
jgi:hypothetical protein